MDDAAQGSGDIFEATVFLSHFNDLTDLRQPGKVVYPLDEVLLLALLAVLAGAETFTDIARFGDKKLAHLIHSIAGIRWWAWYNHLESRRDCLFTA